MTHPVIFNRKSLVFTLIIWGAIILSHMFILTFFYQQKVWYALADSFIFNACYLILFLGIWYPVRFINLKQASTLEIFLNHLGIVTISLVLWYVVSYNLVNAYMGNVPDYMTFLSNSAPWRLAMGFFYYLITIFIYYLYISFRNMEEKMAQEAELKGLIRETELSLLKSQINPHFLFNSLNSISSLTITNPDKAQEMIIKLSDFLRYSIGQKEKQLVSLKEELYNINLYLDIEKIRFGDRLNFSMEVPEICCNMVLPNMILQPLIENAIKHGVYESTEPISIQVNCKSEGINLKITIQNDFDPTSKGKKGTGMGLRNILNRLKIIYQIDNLMTISRKDNLFVVTLLFPQT